jgi:ubiquinone/menaquinone biosynthesis C-methylase UbiE
VPDPRSIFVDPTAVRGRLYATPGRLAQRTGALHRAKIHGRHCAQVIADMAVEAIPPNRSRLTIADLGCGRGTTTRVLAERLQPRRIIALDLSAPLLATASSRLEAFGAVGFVCADFHRLPLRDATFDLIVAAFCLYHSHRPATVIADIARCLTPGGTVLLVTKSADSYRKLDQLVAASGLDPHATERPSLYATAHSDNLADLTATALDVQQVVHETHRFRFADLAHVADYLSTTPKYALPDKLRADPAALAAALKGRLPDRPLTTDSTITYVMATR